MSKTKKKNVSTHDDVSDVEQAASDAVTALFSDQSVSLKETASRLRALRDEIDVCLDALE